MVFGLILALGAMVEQIAADPANRFEVRGPELRVRQTAGGPRLFRDGEMIRPRFAYVSFGTGATPIGADWTKVELPFVLPRSFARLQIQMRFPQPSETGDVSLRGFSIRRADGKPLDCIVNGSFGSDAAFAKTWRQTIGVGGGPALYLPQNLDRAIGNVDEHPFPSKYADGAWTTTLSPWGDRTRPPDYTLVSSYFGLEADVGYVLSYEARSAVVDSVLPSLYSVSEDERRYSSIPMGTNSPAVSTLRHAAAAGVHPTLYCPPANRYPEGEDWRWNDLYCDRLVRADPQVLLIPRLTIDAPEWWLRAHPDARMKNEKGEWISQSSVASREYREDALRYLARFLRHMCERYPRNFGGIQPVGQTTSEWFYQGSQVKMTGYDPSTRDAFRRWLREHGRAGWETAEVPSPERRRAKAEGSVFVDPVAQADVLDFNRFLQDDMADFLGDVFALCRKLTKGKKLVYTFYGYGFEFLCNGPTPAASGHYGLQRLLDRSAADMDMMCAPISYINRGWTGTSINMGVPETVERAGIMWFDENDSRTYLAKPSMADSGPGLCLQTKEKTMDVVRRDTSREILRNYGSWWMDLQGRGWWNDADIWRIVPETEEMERKMLGRTSPFSPEVALIIDEESLLHVGGGTVRELGGLVHCRRMLSLIGAPFGQYLLSDVVRNGLDAKFQVYLATWFGKVPPPRPGVVRLFVQVPGAPEPSGLGSDDIVMPVREALPGFYDSKSPEGKRPLKLRDLAEKAGVRLYLDRSEIGKAVVWASDGYVSIQAIEDGFRDYRKGECRFGTTTEFISPAEKREGHTVASFYKVFRNAKAVRKATLDATALGVFEVEVNGARVGNDFLKPGFTGCGQCRHVYTYDVTDLLKREADAENLILAQVAPTWWCDQINTPAKPTPWQLGKEVAFRCELKLEYGDGSHETVRTGPDWLAAYSARTQTAGLYEGEVYDSRESIDYLKPAKVSTEFRGELRPATAKIALREDLTLEPKSIYVTCGAEGATADAYGRAKVVRRYRDGEEIVLNPGEQLVVDFGQNCSAVPSFQFSGRPGTQLEIRHAEMLNESNGEKSRGNDGPAGTPYLASLRSAYAGIRYTFAGGGDTYRPSFTFFGYRYIGVTATAPVTFRRIRSVPVSSITKGMERGTITTGDARLNRLIENIRWGLRSNYISIPTDCPQRDERLGWTADTQVFMNSAAYLTDTYGFLRKYLADLRDGQYGDGLYTCFVPNVRHVFPHWASCGWTDAGVMMPYRLWKWYGGTEAIDECWDSMEKYMAFLRTHETPYRIDHADWLAYEHKDRTPGADNRGQDPKYKTVMNSYFHYWMADLMRQMAEATGRKARAAAYADEAAKLRKAFADEYVGEDGCIKDYWKGQCSDLYMLKLGLCGNAAAVEKTKKDLIDNIRAHGNRLQTGFLGTAILMPTLTFEANAPDVAYDLLFQDQDPSWLYSVDQGATTVWERWNSYTKEKGFGPTSMNSFNHYAYGCVLEWLFSAAAGIRPDPQQPGWKHFILQPFADRRLGHLEASYDSPVGRITSSWKYDGDGKLHWSFSIPEGATATVIAPGGMAKEYTGGVYEL